MPPGAGGHGLSTRFVRRRSLSGKCPLKEPLIADRLDKRQMALSNPFQQEEIAFWEVSSKGVADRLVKRQMALSNPSRQEEFTFLYVSSTKGAAD